ncbi:MAG: hypothetical protein KBT04_08145 [Bacteroidales bacterium]|nr:hypothetical protein [Candidatus Colimorpha onthohippi]
MIFRILITDDTHPTLADRLRMAGFDVVVDPSHDYDSLLSVVNDFDAIVVRSKIAIDRNFLDHVHRLKCIGRVGAGMETIDVAYAESLGICCVNSPEGNRDAVGEHAMGLLLALFDRISHADAEVRQGVWHREANRGREVKGCTVGIIGFGNMGASFAKRLSGFDCEIIAYDKYKKAGFAPDYVREVSLQSLQQSADVLSLHVSLTTETYHLVDADFLSKFAKPVALINTSRGAVVDTPALAAALKSGSVSGAALDVIEYENMAKDGLNIDGLTPDFQYLLQSDRTVITPHVAGWTVESKNKLADVLADKIIQTFNQYRCADCR